MIFQVEMAAGPPQSPFYRFFTCNDKAWFGLLELARELGWRPLGTVPRTPSDWSASKPFEPTYKPYDWCFEKKVMAADARNLAKALERACERMISGELAPMPHRGPAYIIEGLTAEGLRRANAGITPELLEELIHFLRGGGFYFGWAD